MLSVFNNSDSVKATRLVALALADYAHPDGSNAWPAVATIAKKARVDERTVQRALRWLASNGEIVETGRTKNGVPIYHLTTCTPLKVDIALSRPGGDKLSPEDLEVQVTVQGSGDNVPPEDSGQDVTPGATTPREPTTIDPGLPLAVQGWIGKNAHLVDAATAREILATNYRLEGVQLELAVAYHAQRRNACA